MARPRTKHFTVVHISDLHCGSPYFVVNLANRVVEEVNEIGPDAVVATGDLTDQGYLNEYKMAQLFLDQLECRSLVVVPGNHDARNVGYMHFEGIFGERKATLDLERAKIIGIDSSEPDLDIGRIGRERYKWIREQFAGTDAIKILAMHHHVLPVPGAGRERNIVYDAGDLLSVVVDCGVDIILCGHKHVSNVWRLENLLVVNAGTASSMKLRGMGKPCYNVIRFEADTIQVTRKYTFGEGELIAERNLRGKRT